MYLYKFRQKFQRKNFLFPLTYKQVALAKGILVKVRLVGPF